MADGQLLIGNGSNFSPNTLTAGAGIAITNGPGTITITNTGGGGGGAETGTWSDNLNPGSRVAGTTYQNTSGKKRRVSIPLNGVFPAGRLNAFLEVGPASPPNRRIWHGNIAVPCDSSSEHNLTPQIEVPNNWYYRLTIGEGSVENWFELDE